MQTLWMLSKIFDGPSEVLAYNQAETDAGSAVSAWFYDSESCPTQPDMSESFEVLWDIGASHSITFNEGDFVGPIRRMHRPIPLKGLSVGLQVDGIGQVKYSIKLSNGKYKQICLDTFLVPQSPRSLLCPQQLCKAHNTNPANKGNRMTVTQDEDSYNVHFGQYETIIVPYDTATNLPISLASNAREHPKSDPEFHPCVVDEQNQNLTTAQKELLKWHFRLGHISFQAIQTLLRTGVLARSDQTKALHKAASTCALPKCASCQFGKARCRPAPSKTSMSVASNEGALKQNVLHPGQKVSVDHFICSTKGRLYTSRGKTAPHTMYCGGALFVDHASKFIHVEHQISTTSHETILSKHAFEEFARDHGVIVQTYLADNSTAFASAEYTSHLATFRQITQFAGVGAHHHNGVAERAIQTIMAMARTMLIHAAIRWPDVADASLWPMAVDYAVYIYNHMPDPKTGMAPIDVFSSSKWPSSKCLDLHVWGSPAYVLDPTLQDGKKLPRWKPRSRRALFVGLSKRHSSSVPLVLNLLTHYISPQFHTMFDDWFTTVTSDADVVPDFTSALWSNLFANSRFQYPFDDDSEIPGLGDEWQDASNRLAHQDILRDARDAHVPPRPFDQPSAPNAIASGTPPPAPDLPPPTAPRLSPSVIPPQTLEQPDQRELPDQREPPQLNVQKDERPPIRHSKRPNAGRPPERLRYDEFNLCSGSFNICSAIQEDEQLTQADKVASFLEFHPATSSSTNPDTLTYDEAMCAHDVSEFKAAMGVEIRGLEKHETWELVDKTEEYKANKDILPGTWAFHRKRGPDGMLKKHISWYCV
jgi:hypothetical protein